MKANCENCKHYQHTPNILGGIAECLLAKKSLFTFILNDSCELHSYTDEDKHSQQNKMYKESGIPLKLNP